MPIEWSATVDCCEEMGSQTENYDDERGLMSASVRLRCAYEDRHDLVASICGIRKAWPKGAAGLVPVAQTASIVPVETPADVAASDGQGINYKEAIVTVNYSTKVVDAFSESIEPTAEFVQLPYQLFRWGAGDGPLLREDEAPGKLVRGLNLVRTEYNLLSLDPTVISLTGSCNSLPYVSPLLGLTFGVETLLYGPPNIQFKRDSTGLASQKYDVTKKFTYSPQGWNTYFRGFTGAYQKIYLAGSASPYNSYPIADLTPVLS